MGNQTNSQDPQAINSRAFVGNLNTFQCTKTDVERMFQRYGRIAGEYPWVWKGLEGAFQENRYSPKHSWNWKRVFQEKMFIPGAERDRGEYP